MLGPIFHLEMLLGGRRGRQYYLRWFVGGILCVQLLGFYLTYWQTVEVGKQENFGQVPPNAASNFGNDFTKWLLMQQFLIVLLATPVFTAGAVTDEKTRGTLLYLFSADLNAWEILAGKLLGRAFEVLILLLTTLPFMCFIGIFGGVTPVSLLAIGLMFLGPVFAIRAARLGVISLRRAVPVGRAGRLRAAWGRRSRDAVRALCAVGAVRHLLGLGRRERGGWARPAPPLPGEHRAGPSRPARSARARAGR